MGKSKRREALGIFYLFCLALFYLGLLNSCSTTDVILGPVTKTDLSKSISAATKVVINTYEGAAAGNYARGSRAILIEAVTLAQTVYASKTSTQADLDNATKDLDAAVAAYKAQVIVEIDPQNLVGQWTFDQIAVALAGVTAHDYSLSKNDGVLKAGHSYWGGGVPSIALDRYGVDNRALHFNKGANIEIPYSASLNPSVISIALWVKIDVYDPVFNNQYLVSMNRKYGYHLNFMDTQKVNLELSTAENPGVPVVGSNSAQIAQGNWVHLVVTFGRGHMTFYVNGVQDYDLAIPGNIIQLSPGTNLVFGQDLPSSLYSYNAADPHYVSDGGFLSGALDEIRIYKSILTADQITSIYNLEKP